MTMHLLVEGGMLPAAVRLCQAGHVLHLLTHFTLPVPQVCDSQPDWCVNLAYNNVSSSRALTWTLALASAMSYSRGWSF